MSSKSAMDAQFAESSTEMGERISTAIESNDAMRERSVINVSMRTVG